MKVWRPYLATVIYIIYGISIIPVCWFAFIVVLLMGAAPSDYQYTTSDWLGALSLVSLGFVIGISLVWSLAFYKNKEDTKAIICACLPSSPVIKNKNTSLQKPIPASGQYNAESEANHVSSNERR